MPARDFVSTRTTEPDPASLLAQLRALDATAGVGHLPGTQEYRLKKATAWTAQQIISAQNVLDTAPPMTPRSVAQSQIDAWIAGGTPEAVAMKAVILALIDDTNRLRAALRGLGVQNLPDVTPTAALNAVRAKAGTV